MSNSSTRPGSFLAGRTAVLASVLNWNPVTFFVRTSLISVVLLLLPSYWLGIHDLTYGKQNVGFWYEPNWSLMFPIVLPAIFAGFLYLSSLMVTALRDLEDPNLRVITSESELRLEDDFSQRFHRVRWITLATAAGLALLLVFLDTLSLQAVYSAAWRGDEIPSEYLNWSGPLQASSQDWSTAFTFTPDVHWTSNLVFTLLAYSFEAGVIFLGFFFIFSFWRYFRFISQIINPARSTIFTFHPIDTDTRLGLRPLGRIMNMYLGLVLIFEAYVFLHRLQLIGRSPRFTIPSYLGELLAAYPSLPNLFDRRLLAFDSVNIGTWMLLIFMTLPLLAAAYFPIWTLRRYLAIRRDALWRDYAREHEAAVTRGDDKQAALLHTRMNMLNGVELWPNGDAAAYRLLSYAAALAIAAWAPPVLLALIALGVCGEVLSLLVQKVRA